ncbi:hypothetical protein, partial [Rhizorhabdus argentea]|uniref:hypothetical protein n=1 Tax=Rhizorhabdus argentea TaxID=1387174 RepID=UPI0030ED1730
PDGHSGSLRDRIADYGRDRRLLVERQFAQQSRHCSRTKALRVCTMLPPSIAAGTSIVLLAATPLMFI